MAERKLIKFTRTLSVGDKGDDVKVLQQALLDLGYFKGTVLGNFAVITLAAVRFFQKDSGLVANGVVDELTVKALNAALAKTEKPHAISPGYLEAKKLEGLRETDPKLEAILVPYWKKLGLPGYKSLSGSKFAWCSVLIFATYMAAGLDTSKMTAAAISQDNNGIKIDFRKDGIPKSAKMRINSSGDCKSLKGNHTNYADCDFAAADFVDLAKDAKGVWTYKVRLNATIPGLGGNQGDMVKRSYYKVRNICSVTWDPKVPLPGPIKKTIGCGQGAAGSESTR